MNYYDFMMQLECIAVEKGLRLYIERAPVGCGFFLHFGDRSNYIVWLNGKEEPKELFARLRELADKYRRR